MVARLVSTIFGAGIVLVVAAAPASAADDIEAKVQTCNVCHGQNGVPIDPKTMPIIWGQQASYLMKQLRNYRSGEHMIGKYVGPGPYPSGVHVMGSLAISSRTHTSAV